MTITLDIQQDLESPAGIEDALKVAAEAALENERITSAMLTILLTDDRTMRSLNRQFRAEDKSTDVLSFPFGEEEALMDDQPPYLGDIAISVPYAGRQAEAQGHSTTAELQLLTIHGILHLLGYDHNTEDSKNEMWVVQRELLDGLQLSHVQPTEGS
ncbi:MAG: rRNA maturation RNase YbeY [Candidatus Promineifilaceae bacterium]|jgi:probable rRNA maturation factor